MMMCRMLILEMLLYNSSILYNVSTTYHIAIKEIGLTLNLSKKEISKVYSVQRQESKLLSVSFIN